MSANPNANPNPEELLQAKLERLIIAAVNAGKLPMLGTYLGCKTISKEYVSSKTGKKMPLKLAAHIVVTGDETNTRSVQVEEVLPDDFDISKFVAPAKRGDTVIVYIQQIKEERGAVSARPEKLGIIAVSA